MVIDDRQILLRGPEVAAMLGISRPTVSQVDGNWRSSSDSSQWIGSRTQRCAVAMDRTEDRAGYRGRDMSANTGDSLNEPIEHEFYAPFEDEEFTETHWKLWTKHARPGMLKYFEQAALLEIARGRKKFAPDAIIALFRWNTSPDLQQKQGDYKICQNIAPLLSRWFVARHPEYVSFFTFKRLHTKGKQNVTTCPFCHSEFAA